jgi:hypothetical protein
LRSAYNKGASKCPQRPAAPAAIAFSLACEAYEGFKLPHIFRVTELKEEYNAVFQQGLEGVESNWVHSARRPPIVLLCQPRVIMMLEKLVE